jgi:hypothetical protein
MGQKGMNHLSMVIQNTGGIINIIRNGEYQAEYTEKQNK